MEYLRESRGFHNLQGKWLAAAFLVIVLAFGTIWIASHSNGTYLPTTGAVTGDSGIFSSCAPSAKVPWGVAKVGGGLGGEGMKIAILDTGIVSHKDLHASVCIDTTSGKIVSGCNDQNGRGTHLAGIIAARDGTLGVAPAADLMIIKTCDVSGTCSANAVAEGIRYAVDNGANIILLPIMRNDETAVRNAVAYGVQHGALFVAPAGDSGSITWPAADAKVIAVGAIGSDESVASWSARGSNYQTTAWLAEENDVEFAAPGIAIESTWINGCYRALSGTNVAAAHVAGLAAKLWQGSAAATRTYLQYISRYYHADIGQSGDDPEAGFGLPVTP